MDYDQPCNSRSAQSLTDINSDGCKIRGKWQNSHYIGMTGWSLEDICHNQTVTTII